MTFRINVLSRANRDVNHFMSWIAHERKSPQGAVSWYQAYESALERLAHVADQQPLAPENEFADFEVRHMAFRRAASLALPVAELARVQTRSLATSATGNILPAARLKTRRGRPYRLLFTLDDCEVRVLHVRGPGQDLVSADELNSSIT